MEEKANRWRNKFWKRAAKIKQNYFYLRALSPLFLNEESEAQVSATTGSDSS
jgi:hypothetical protein